MCSAFLQYSKNECKTENSGRTRLSTSQCPAVDSFKSIASQESGEKVVDKSVTTVLGPSQEYGRLQSRSMNARPHEVQSRSSIIACVPSSRFTSISMAGETVSAGQATLPSTNSTASFWHCQPSTSLLGHRTTEHLPSTADVVIIGSGITGAFAARHIADQERGKGLDVLMLEAREACWGATGRNGGHCQPNLYTKPPHIARFELDNFDTIRALITENRIDCEWQDVDSCHGYTNTALFEANVASVNALRSLDVELGNMVSVVNSKSVNPSLSDLSLGSGVVGAIVQKHSASLWPYKLVAWILERLLSTRAAGRAMGGTETGSFNLQTSTPVTSLQRCTMDGTWVVQTPRGMVAAKETILATNAYTSYLLPEFASLITPVRGQMSALLPPSAMRPGDGNPVAGRNSYGFYGRGTGEGSTFNQDDYLVQRPFLDVGSEGTGGHLMFGGGRQYENGYGVGVSDDSEIDHPAASYLRRELIQELDLPKEEAELRATYEWTGIMGFSKDNRPWVGEVPETMGGGKGLWICAGFTGHGMPNANLCAAAVVDMMMGKRAEEVKLPFEFQISTRRIEMAQVLLKPPLQRLRCERDDDAREPEQLLQKNDKNDTTFQ